jgi:replicative DNA helicase
MDKILKIEDLYRKVDTESVDISYVDYWSKITEGLVSHYIESYGLRTKTKNGAACSVGCENCQVSHIEKYKKDYPSHPVESKRKIKADPKSFPTHAFQISCPLIPKNYLDQYSEVAKDLNDEEKEVLLITSDPVVFAEKMFNWKPRAHQEISLRCQSKKKVYRFGRRSGKSDSLAVEILFHAFTKIREYYDEDIKENVTGIKILICCPFDSQVTAIFNRMLELLNSNSNLKKEFKYKQSPYHQIRFENGAVISGFTTGSNGASAVRGQDAHLIVLDEVDYMTEKDFTTILPIAQSHSDCLIRVASTPSGLRSKFYEWCQGAPDWKEFYFPTAVIDETPFAVTKLSWKNLRTEMRREYTSDGWLQEIMAIFISYSDGVFATPLVSIAMENYRYEDMRQQRLDGGFSGFKFSLGVDWNTSFGTWICITGYHPSIGLRVMEIVNVPKQNFTQLQGLQKITELLSFWQPEHVYVDKGHGATQWETLKMWSSQQKPGTYEFNVQRKIKAYDFGSKISIREPGSGRLIEHPAKPFLVENAVRRFEDRTIKFSFEDELLKKQLLNYIIKSRQPNGTPVFGQDNNSIGDHALDAFMLSLVAYTIEDGPLAINKGVVSSVGIKETLGHQMLGDQMQGDHDQKLSGAELLRRLHSERNTAIDNRKEGSSPFEKKTEHYSDLDRRAWERDMIVSRDKSGAFGQRPAPVFHSRHNYQKHSGRIIK